MIIITNRSSRIFFSYSSHALTLRCESFILEMSPGDLESFLQMESLDPFSPSRPVRPVLPHTVSHKPRVAISTQ